MLEMSKPI